MVQVENSYILVGKGAKWEGPILVILRDMLIESNHAYGVDIYNPALWQSKLG